jgi:hypothetical protein
MSKYISKSEAKRCMKTMAKYASQETKSGASKIKSKSKKLYKRLKSKTSKMF